MVFAALLVLLLATVGAAYLDLGRGNLPVALTIAAVKAALIMMFFMHVRYSNRLTLVFSGAALLWLGILLTLTTTDFSSRDWLHIAGK